MMFSTHEMKYIRYLPKRSKFSFYFILFIGYLQCLTTEKGGAENANSFGTKIFVTF